jgi:hypothetical protein
VRARDVRWIYLRMIEECAAAWAHDLVRERIYNVPATRLVEGIAVSW